MDVTLHSLSRPKSQGNSTHFSQATTPRLDGRTLTGVRWWVMYWTHWDEDMEQQWQGSCECSYAPPGSLNRHKLPDQLATIFSHSTYPQHKARCAVLTNWEIPVLLNFFPDQSLSLRPSCGPGKVSATEKPVNQGRCFHEIQDISVIKRRQPKGVKPKIKGRKLSCVHWHGTLKAWRPKTNGWEGLRVLKQTRRNLIMSAMIHLYKQQTSINGSITEIIPVPTLPLLAGGKNRRRGIPFVVVLAHGRVTLMQDVIFHPTA
jgi:hypothetical protein